MLRVFNAFQIVSLFCALPFVIMWLSQAEFAGAQPLMYLAIVVYGIMFIANVGMISEELNK